MYEIVGCTVCSKSIHPHTVYDCLLWKLGSKFSYTLLQVVFTINTTKTYYLLLIFPSLRYNNYTETEKLYVLYV